MLTLILSLTACEKAFPKFMKTYKKNYATDEQRAAALKNFCRHYNFAKSRPHNDLRINELSDLDRPPLSGHIQGPINKISYENIVAAESTSATLEDYNRPTATVDLVQAVCKFRGSSWDTFKEYDISKIYSGDLPYAVDLRKITTIQTPYDQGTCGSCYAQATRFVMHSLFVHDIYYYSINENFKEYFKNINNRIKFSVQYIMNHTYGSNQYCAGGNFITVANDFFSGKVPSLQYESDYPYISMMDSDDYPPLNPPIKSELKSDFTTKQVLNPVHWIDAAENECPRGVINLDLTNDTQRDHLKAFLARGIAVAGYQYVPDDQASAMKYSMYKSSILTAEDYPCPVYKSNHYVTFVGYGTYKGVEVWVVQNSWGSSWGVQGTGYFKIGDNALCYEVEAQAVLPRYLGYDELLEPLNTTFNESQLYKKAVEKGLILDLYPQIKWGYSGLDSFEGGYPKFVKGKLSSMAWIVIIAIAAMALVCLYFVCICLVRPPPNHVNFPYYVRLGYSQASFLEWRQGVNAVYSNLTTALSKDLDGADK